MRVMDRASLSIDTSRLLLLLLLGRRQVSERVLKMLLYVPGQSVRVGVDRRVRLCLLREDVGARWIIDHRDDPKACACVPIGCSSKSPISWPAHERERWVRMVRERASRQGLLTLKLLELLLLELLLELLLLIHRMVREPRDELGSLMSKACRTWAPVADRILDSGGRTSKVYRRGKDSGMMGGWLLMMKK